jgi:hypothetical protein
LNCFLPISTIPLPITYPSSRRSRCCIRRWCRSRYPTSRRNAAAIGSGHPSAASATSIAIRSA